MKKIIIIFTLFAFLSCSENNETNNNNKELQSKLIGTWKNDGYYTDIANPNPVITEAENFYPISNGAKITYYTNTFSSSYLDEPIYSGNYSVSNDSLLSYNNEIIGKIWVNDTQFIVSDPSGYEATRYIKINDN